MPPMPSNVTSRACWSRSSDNAAIVSTRPTKASRSAGKLFGIRRAGTHPSTVLTTRYALPESGGGSSGEPASPKAKSSIGSATPLKRQCPKRRARAAVAPISSMAAEVTSVCPPCAADITRAAIARATPWTSSLGVPLDFSAVEFSITLTGPTCRPTRAFMLACSALTAR